MIKFESKGSFKNSYRFLQFLARRKYLEKLDEYGKMGVEALSAATPVRTGKTAASWSYEIDTSLNSVKITWTNSNMAYGNTPVVILLQYGHGTKSGKYVQGRDFINPALRPVFDNIADQIWKEVNEA